MLVGAVLIQGANMWVRVAEVYELKVSADDLILFSMPALCDVISN